MFIVILSAVLGLMHLYLWKRLVKDTTRPGRTRWILTAVLVGLATLLLATLILPRVIGVTASAWVAWPGYFWFALVVYLFLTLLVLEPVRLALRGWVKRKPLKATATTTTQPAVEDEPTAAPTVNRRVFLARASAVAAGAASVSLVGVGAASALGPPDLIALPVRLRKLDPVFNGFRIAVVSDIHLGQLSGRAHTERIVRMINETAPDLVAIVGDLVDRTVDELGPAAEPLRDLDSREGTFFVTGNHEYFVEDPFSWLRQLERLGVQPLRNENTAIRRGAAAFDLAGVNDIAGESWSDAPDFVGWTCNCLGTRTAARCGHSTTSSAPFNRPSPDCPLWATRSYTSREARGSGVRRCGSARHRTSPCYSSRARSRQRVGRS
jgi:hypothetical protein